MPIIPISEFERHLPDLLALLRQMVEIESPTTDKPSVDQLGTWLGREMSRMGADVERFEQAEVGDHWLGRWGKGGGGILILGHMDTVHPLGSAARMPWREVEDRIYGPGILDMKAGLALSLIALRVLRDSRAISNLRLSLLCTSDEETGSATSRALIEKLAPEYSLVLVVEPALSDGALKTWRKGIGEFHLHARGRAAHAGGDPENGVNAIIEMSRQIQHLQGLANDKKGTTVNVGVIRGGVRSNVVPESCTAKVDIRVRDRREQLRIERELQRLIPNLEGAEISLSGGWNRPPMPRSPVIAEAFARAKAIASRLGIALGEGGTGGGSDANFVAPLRVPLLDGMGAIGAGAHSTREHVVRHELPPRAALLAAVISEWDSAA
jgi:glutamate carboxypeptidase